MSAFCPECDAELDIDEADVEIGDELSCAECGALLRVASDDPLELDFADEDDEDEEDDKESDGDGFEDEDDDEDDEDDDED